MRRKKIIPYQNIDEALLKLKNQRVLVGGCFDLLHIGHIRFLANAKKQGENLIIALESDEFIKKKKKRQPFHTQKERAEILSFLSIVDLVILLPYFSKDKQYDLLVEKIKPDIIAVTESDPMLSQKKKQGKKVGAKTIAVTAKIHQKASRGILKIMRNSI